MKSSIYIASVAALMAFASDAQATQFITNGGFETGDYTGWGVNVQAGSSGNLQVVANNGGASPLSAHATASANPIGGSFYSITDQGGPGSYALVQSFTLSQAATVVVSYDMFLNNSAGTVAANGRNYAYVPNQNAEVDILTGGAAALTNTPGDMVAVLFNPASTPTSPENAWHSYSTTVALAAGTYQFRFAETDNSGYFQAGLDNVSVTTLSAPAPAAGAGLASLGAMAVFALGSRRRRATA
jgi:hypothetical protein